MGRGEVMPPPFESGDVSYHLHPPHLLLNTYKSSRHMFDSIACNDFSIKSILKNDENSHLHKTVG